MYSALALRSSGVTLKSKVNRKRLEKSFTSLISFYTYHDHEADGLFISEYFIAPTTNGSHTFDGGDTIVGDEYLVDHFIAIEPFDELLRSGQDEVMSVPVMETEMNSRH